MIDLVAIKARIAAMPNPDDQTAVTRRCLEQLVEELAACRSAQQHQGEAFGLKGQSL
jgi:hypothetical protein